MLEVEDLLVRISSGESRVPLASKLPLAFKSLLRCVSLARLQMRVTFFVVASKTHSATLPCIQINQKRSAVFHQQCVALHRSFQQTKRDLRDHLRHHRTSMFSCLHGKRTPTPLRMAVDKNHLTSGSTTSCTVCAELTHCGSRLIPLVARSVSEVRLIEFRRRSNGVH